MKRMRLVTETEYNQLQMLKKIPPEANVSLRHNEIRRKRIKEKGKRKFETQQPIKAEPIKSEPKQETSANGLNETFLNLSKSYILKDVAGSNKNQVIDFLIQNGVKWNDKLEAIVDNKRIPGSNITNIIKNIFKSEKEPPVGYNEVINTTTKPLLTSLLAKSEPLDIPGTKRKRVRFESPNIRRSERLKKPVLHWEYL